MGGPSREEKRPAKAIDLDRGANPTFGRRKYLLITEIKFPKSPGGENKSHILIGLMKIRKLAISCTPLCPY